MSFFSYIFRKYQQNKKVSNLNDEIIALIEKKAELEVEIQKLELNLQDLNKQQTSTQRYIDLNTAIKQAELKLTMINDEVDSESKALDELKKDLVLIEDCKSYKSMLEKLSVDLQNSNDMILKNIFDKFPNAHLKPLYFLDEFKNYGKLEVPPDHILLIIEKNLMEFAITHSINIEQYKNFIYALNSLWFKEFDKIKHRSFINLLGYNIIFNTFMVIKD